MSLASNQNYWAESARGLLRATNERLHGYAGTTGPSNERYPTSHRIPFVIRLWEPFSVPIRILHYFLFATNESNVIVHFSMSILMEWYCVRVSFECSPRSVPIKTRWKPFLMGRTWYEASRSVSKFYVIRFVLETRKLWWMMNWNPSLFWSSKVWCLYYSSYLLVTYVYITLLPIRMWKPQKVLISISSVLICTNSSDWTINVVINLSRISD